jgi:hypothetical protein
VATLFALENLDWLVSRRTGVQRTVWPVSLRFSVRVPLAVRSYTRVVDVGTKPETEITLEAPFVE